MRSCTASYQFVQKTSYRKLPACAKNTVPPATSLCKKYCTASYQLVQKNCTASYQLATNSWQAGCLPYNDYKQDACRTEILQAGCLSYKKQNLTGE